MHAFDRPMDRILIARRHSMKRDENAKFGDKRAWPKSLDAF